MWLFALSLFSLHVPSELKRAVIEILVSSKQNRTTLQTLQKYTNPTVPKSCSPEMVESSFALSKPLLGRTQYCLGAVVLTLKMTESLVGFFSFRVDVTTSVKGPVEK